jgi:ComF family protein
MRTVVDGLVSVLLAPCCAACHRPLDEPTASIVCEPCWTAIKTIRPPYCGVCGDPMDSWRAGVPAGRCARCLVRRSHITLGRSVGEYEGALRDILHALKYDRRRSTAGRLSALMRVHGQAALAGADYAVPVPLHWRRRWSRGFNQAAVLAGGLGLPVVGALRRIRHTRSQTDLPADRRRTNVRGAFGIRRSLPGAVVVLVDDVSTTGATLEGCAKVLVEAGAREVRTLTAARAVTRRHDGRLP